MFFSPLNYEEPLFRPPSEAGSLIFQVTIGCSWNQCAFCEMYTHKQFRIRNMGDIEQDILEMAKIFPDTRKIFLADGNAMVLSTGKLLRILEKIRVAFARVSRVSVYASSGDLENKTEDELRSLKDAGLKLIYVGIESGDAGVLAMVNKGETPESISRNLLKAKSAGIKSSVMILTGLGGKKYSRAHAVHSARLVSLVQPDYLSTLVLSFPYGTEHFKNRFGGEFIEMTKEELLKELFQFIGASQLDQVVFRSDHASNYLALKGVLGRDQEKLLRRIEEALRNPEGRNVRQEWQRGL